MTDYTIEGRSQLIELLAERDKTIQLNTSEGRLRLIELLAERDKTIQLIELLAERDKTIQRMTEELKSCRWWHSSGTELDDGRQADRNDEIDDLRRQLAVNGHVMTFGDGVSACKRKIEEIFTEHGIAFNRQDTVADLVRGFVFVVLKERKNAGVTFPGWWCTHPTANGVACDTFNGEMREKHVVCRHCGVAKPDNPEQPAKRDERPDAAQPGDSCACGKSRGGNCPDCNRNGTPFSTETLAWREI